MEIKEQLISSKSEVKKDSIYRHAYAYVAILFVFIFTGFYPTYFSRMGKTDWAHHLHVVIAKMWMFLLITQTYLIGHDNVRLLVWARFFSRSKDCTAFRPGVGLVV